MTFRYQKRVREALGSSRHYQTTLSLACQVCLCLCLISLVWCAALRLRVEMGSSQRFRIVKLVAGLCHPSVI